MKKKARPSGLLSKDPDTNDIKINEEFYNKSGIDHWICMSIEGKRREVLKQQMVKEISQIKVLKFVFKD